MRLITFIVAIIAASTPAGAQGWREYEHPNEGFKAAFPAEPKVETTSYQAPSGRMVEARVYFVVQEGGKFKVTVAEKNPWTSLTPNIGNDQFQFVVISDRTGGHRDKIFSRAVHQVNLLQPEFVVSVGDLIEGYTVKPEVFTAQWEEFDG